jgi:hypothetical protein
MNFKKFIAFFFFFTYVNIIIFHSGEAKACGKMSYSGETVMDVILDDVLNLPQHQDPDLDYVNEDYRPATNHLIKLFIPVFQLLDSFIPLNSFDYSYRLAVFNVQFVTQPGYYQYLFRLKPF